MPPEGRLRQSSGDRLWIVLAAIRKGAIEGYLWSLPFALLLPLLGGWGVGFHPWHDVLLLGGWCCGVGIVAGGLIGLHRWLEATVSSHPVEVIEQHAGQAILKAAMLGFPLAAIVFISMLGQGWRMAFAAGCAVWGGAAGSAAVFVLVRGSWEAVRTRKEKRRAGIALARSDWTQERLERWEVERPARLPTDPGQVKDAGRTFPDGHR